MCWLFLLYSPFPSPNLPKYQNITQGEYNCDIFIHEVNTCNGIQIIDNTNKYLQYKYSTYGNNWKCISL